MLINEEKLNSLLQNEFVIDCIHIQLTQQTDNDPLVYAGSGSIFQKPDGNFHLKLYHAFNDFPKEMFANLDAPTPGKIIEDEKYFSMEAVDMSGDTWKAKNISVDGHFSIPAAGKVISTIVRKLWCENDRDGGVDKKSSNLFLVIPGKHKIPCNEYEDFPSGAFSLNTCKLNVHGIDLEFKNKKNSLTISAKSPNDLLDVSFKERLVESLSIIFGKQCPVLYSSLAAQDIRTSTLSSIPKSVPNQGMATPIRHYLPPDVTVFQEFIAKYLQSFEKEHDIFFSYWHKINRSWQGGIENAALTISTAIEGIVKNYYSEYGMPDNDIVKQAEEAEQAIRKLAIGSRVKERILSNLGQVRSSSPKNALYKLSKKENIEEELIDSWVSLRNKSTHADNLDDKIDELQKYIDDFYRCHNLFNVLLLLKINFEGCYLDLSKEGWEETSLALDAETEEQQGA